MNPVQLEWDGGEITIPLPDEFRVRYLTPNYPPPLSGAVLEESIREDFKRLRPEVKIASKIVLIVEDSTRITQTAFLIEQVVKEIRSIRGSMDGVDLILAAGAHGTIPADMVIRKTGYTGIKAIVHNALENEELEKVGESRTGIPLFFNRRVIAAHLRLTVSTVNIHPMAGFSGGGKILLPGVAGLETIGAFHRLSSGMPGDYHTPMRELINEVTALLPIRFSWHLGSTPFGKIAALFGGSLETVHHQGISALKTWVTVPRPMEAAGLILAGCRPYNQNLLGTYKSFAQLNELLQPDGTLILFNEATHGRGVHYWRNQPQVIQSQKNHVDQLFHGKTIALYSPDSDAKDFSDLFPRRFHHLKFHSELVAFIKNRVAREGASQTALVIPYAPVTLIGPAGPGFP